MLYLGTPWKSRHSSTINAACVVILRLFGALCQIGTADAAPCRSIVTCIVTNGLVTYEYARHGKLAEK